MINQYGQTESLTIIGSVLEGVLKRELIKAVEQGRYVPADNVEMTLLMDMRASQE